MTLEGVAIVVAILSLLVQAVWLGLTIGRRGRK